MSEKKKDWPPFRNGSVARNTKLTLIQIDELLKRAGAQNYKNRDTFIEKIELAIDIYKSGRINSEITSPAEVRKKLRKLSRQSNQLLKSFSEMDGTTWDLLQEIDKIPFSLNLISPSEA